MATFNGSVLKLETSAFQIQVAKGRAVVREGKKRRPHVM
jgi:hypothetical protein